VNPDVAALSSDLDELIDDDGAPCLVDVDVLAVRLVARGWTKLSDLGDDN